jgi:type I restriction enzyme S subunit
MSDVWVRTTFGKIAQRRTEIWNPGDPEAIYIGLEHISPYELRLLGTGVSTAVSSNKTRFLAHDVLFGKLRPYFQKVVRPPFPGVCSTDIWALYPSDESQVDPGFLHWIVADPAFSDFANSAETGTRMPRASWQWVSTYELALPPLEEQRRIAEVLGALDDRMDAAARLTEILLNEAHAIYDVRAAGESAQVVRVGDIVSALDKGVSYKGAGLAEEGPWLVNLANFSAVGRFKREGTKHYTLPVRPQHRVSPGDLVIANTDLTQDRVILGQPALIPPGAQDAAVTHHVYAVRFAPEHAVYRLPLYFALRSQDFQDRSYLFGSGTTVAGLSRDAVLDYTCAMPPKGELPALTAELATRLEAVWRLEAEIDELRRTRDFLLPRLVSGELRVAAAEELVEAAT